MRKEHRTLVDIPIEERREIAILYSQSFQWPNTSELCRERDITSTTLRDVLDFAIQDELVDLETARAIADAAANHAFCHAPKEFKENARQRSWNHFYSLIYQREKREKERKQAEEQKLKPTKSKKKTNLDDIQIKMF